MDYQYPLNDNWSTDEIMIVIYLYNAVEQAYEVGIKKEQFIEAYRNFKKVVDSKSEEKQLDKAFKEVSSYSIYEVMKASKENDWIKL